jgi:hypothetical protein
LAAAAAFITFILQARMLDLDNIMFLPLCHGLRFAIGLL